MEFTFSSEYWQASLLLPFMLILIGTSFQVAAGVGLGLVAGPGLLFVFEPIIAVQIAIVINLFLSILLLSSEHKNIDFKYSNSLSAWALLGIPVGLGLLLTMSVGFLKIIGGIFILLAVLQLYLSKKIKTSGLVDKVGLQGGGILSGLMTGSLGIPGPVAIWVLMNSGLDLKSIKATLRAYFIFAYGAALALHLIINGWGEGVISLSLIFIPAILIGMVVGRAFERHIKPHILRYLLEFLLFLMGLVLFYKGVIDVI